jgi:hypothetical protein
MRRAEAAADTAEADATTDERSDRADNVGATLDALDCADSYATSADARPEGNSNRRRRLAKRLERAKAAYNGKVTPPARGCAPWLAAGSHSQNDKLGHDWLANLTRRPRWRYF